MNEQHVPEWVRLGVAGGATVASGFVLFLIQRLVTKRDGGKRESKRGSAGPTGTSRGSLNTAMSLSKWKSNGNGGVLSESESLIPRGKQPW